MTRLGDVVTVSASSIKEQKERYWLLNLDMVEQQTGKIIEYNYVDECELDGSIIQFDTENVLYSKLRPNLNKVVLPMMNGYATSEMLPLRPNKDVLLREYLVAYLRSDEFVTWAVSKTAGAKMPRLGTKELLSKDIPLPTIEKQQEIALQFETIQKLISIRKQQLEKLDELVKARFVEMFGDLAENPFCWPIVKISEISNLLKSGLSRKLLSEDIGLPMIRSCNIQNGLFVYDDIKYWYVNDPQGAKTSDYILDDGDILINFINSMSQIGKTAIFNDVGRECIYTTNIFRMKLTPECNKYYYNWFAMTDYYKRQLQNIIQPAVNQASFTTVNFLNLSIPLPPMELQEQFATFVEQTNKSKAEIQKSLEQLETLKKALMQKYFG